jgi:hypothetical protein
MPKKPRKGCQFSVGDRVEILPTIYTRFIGQHGVIREVQENRATETLDKYCVRLDGHDKEEVFWGFQLRKAA